MGVPLTTKEAAVDAVVALGAWISAHTGATGTTGANEKAGVARVQTTWSADTTDDGERVGTQVILAVPADTYVEYGVWTAEVGGVFIGGVAFTEGNQVFSAAGELKVTPKFKQL
jgi:hypothetical protein